MLVWCVLACVCVCVSVWVGVRARVTLPLSAANKPEAYPALLNLGFFSFATLRACSDVACHLNKRQDATSHGRTISHGDHHVVIFLCANVMVMPCHVEPLVGGRCARQRSNVSLFCPLGQKNLAKKWTQTKETTKTSQSPNHSSHSTTHTKMKWWRPDVRRPDSRRERPYGR